MHRYAYKIRLKSIQKIHIPSVNRLLCAAIALDLLPCFSIQNSTVFVAIVVVVVFIIHRAYIPYHSVHIKYNVHRHSFNCNALSYSQSAIRMYVSMYSLAQCFLSNATHNILYTHTHIAMLIYN